ncbi:hypothetical protein CGERO_05990 [Corynebacterium gerontici]|uniref:Uncharacterized protein n=2 Tax=Corynebacterium gerontici TaxID=2079234 RepID=A0A3G6J0D7_9CORY|nr:hypothetical protein CGERO_05990 [Corynebacterium gerontici]
MHETYSSTAIHARGIPLYTVIVHLSVVAPPAAALSVIVWLLTKRRLGLATIVTTDTRAAATIFAKITGARLLKQRGYSEGQPEPAADHADWATYAVMSVCAMFATAAATWFGEHRGMLTFTRVAKVLLVIYAAVSIITVVATGHGGAMLV